MDEQTKTLKHQILERGVKSLLDEAKVPMREHFKILKVLKERVDAHDASNAAHEKVLEGHKAFIKTAEDTANRHESHMENHERQIADWDSKVASVISRDWTGEQGEMGPPGNDGMDGETPDLDLIVQAVLNKIPTPKDGENGKDAEIEEDRIITLLIKKIQKDKPLDLTHIKGAQKFVKDGISYKFEELMHGGGGTNGTGGGGQIFVQTPVGAIDGVNRAYTTTHPIGIVVGLDYNGEAIHPSEYTVSGSGFTMTTALPVISGAAFTIAYQGTSTIPTGTGINPQIPTGTINGINKVFTANGVVSVISADGQVLNPTIDYSISYNAGTNVTTITYVQAPQSAVFAF